MWLGLISRKWSALTSIRWATLQGSEGLPGAKTWEGETTTDKEEDHALVADEETPTEFALMAKTSADSQVESRLVEFKNQEAKYCEKIKGLEFKVEARANRIECLTNELELLKKEKEGLERKLTGFQSASKDLDSLQERLPKFTDDTVTDYSRPSPAIETDRLTEDKTDKVEIAKKPTIKYAELYRKTTKRSNGNSQNHIDDKGYWDSGCSRHMTGNISYLSDYESFDGGYMSFGQGGCKITGKGIIKTGKLEFKNVYFVKDLKYNLFSVSQICDNKNSVLFTDSECIVLGRDFKLTDDTNVLLRTPRQHNMYTIDLNNIVPHRDLTCLVAKAYVDECMLWHRRPGHLNLKTMNKLVRYNLVRGLPTTCFENDHNCTACLKGKQHKASCKTKLVNSMTKPLHTLHMDLFGPTCVSSLNHKWYCLVVTDDFSWFTWTFFLKTKDETSGILRNFITEIENLKELKVKIIRCDNGGEFRNKEVNDFCLKKGIKREFNNARTPQQNRVAERRNKTLIKAARTMLADAKLPVTFWAEAVKTACYVQNRVLVNKSQNKTPYELFNGRTPAIGFLKPFSCHVMILNILDNLGKFETKGDECYFIGYSMSSKAFRVFNKRTKSVEENLHVDFLENKPIKKGAGPNWLFDIDSLTNSMNYVPVVVTGTNSTNFSGTKEAAGQDVSSLRYIVLPNWFHETHLESSTSNAQDACNADDPESSGNSNPTATSTNLPADHIKTLAVETLIPTVSSPVPTACLNDSLEPSSDTRIISKRVTSQDDTPSLDNILTLTNRFEDILGVTTNTDDTNGVEADLGKMETTITASPTPTFRIHKDHLKSQIIGPVDTLIQTKNKSKEMEEQSFIATIYQNTNPALLQSCLFSCFLSQVEPKKISDSLQDPSWNKKDERGIVIRNKARLVAQGHTQEEWIDYDEVFAPVARIEAIRLFLAYASFIGFTVYQMDVKSTFLYGTIDEEMYVMQPFGFQDPEFPARVYKVEKAMYGLHQAPRAWYVLQKEDGIFLSQDKYVGDILKKFGYSDVRSSNTPMDKENPLGKNRTRKDVDLHLYRSMIRSLIYLTASRPYIMFAVCAGARHQVTLKECHLHAVKRIFRYLKGHPKLGLGQLWPLQQLRQNMLQLLVAVDKFCGFRISCLIMEHRFSPDSGFGRGFPSQCLSPKSTGFNEFSSNIATALVCLATHRVYKFSKMIFDGEGSGTPTEPHHTPSLEAQQTSPITLSSPSPLPVTIEPLLTVIPSDNPLLGNIPKELGLLKVDQDRANIPKTSTLPSDSTPRVTSLAADKGSMQQKLNELTALCTNLQRQQSEMVSKFAAQELEITNLKARRSLDEGEEAAEKGSDDTSEMVTVLTSLDATTVLSSGVAEVPTGSGSIPSAGVPTGSEVVPTASPIFTTIDVQVARESKEEMARDAQRMNEQIARDAEIARLHAEEELQMMIDGLDRDNETQRKPLTKKQHREFYTLVLRNQAGWKAKHFKGMTLEEIKEKFDPVWKQIQDFIPIGSKEESERLKRKRIRFEQDSAKKLKTSEEVPEEKLKEVMELIPVEEVYHLDREDLNQLWALVKETLNIRPTTNDKEKELWVELKRLYEPDVKDQLWTQTQNMMHAPVEWKLYDTCRVHQVISKDQEIFMLVEKDYPLRKGLAIVMICIPTGSDEFPLPEQLPTAKEDKFLLLIQSDATAEELCAAAEVKE
nr:hypothetical protein [Tanacetum cinerariifolium]